MKKNYKKISWLKKKNIQVILKKGITDKRDYKKIFNFLLKKGYSRVFIEAGLSFTSYLVKHKFLNNIYIFKTNYKLNNNGYNNTNSKIIKKIKLKKRLNTYLFGDNVYKEKLK